MRTVSRVYRGLLRRVLPPEFRDTFGAEMAESFDRRLAARQGVARLAFVVRAMADLVWTAVGERRRGADASRLTRTPVPARPRAFDILRHDLTHAARSMRKRPGFATAVVLTLALGVGANAAVFSLLDAVLLQPLPIDRPDRVVALFNAERDDPERGGYGLSDGLSYAAFGTVRQQARSFKAVAGFIDVEVGVRSDRGVTQLTAGAVSGDYFPLLGVRPLIGRMLRPSDEAGDGTRVVVLGESYWSREFGRAPDVLGESLNLGGTVFEVVGVVPAGFHGTRLSSRPDLWFPLPNLVRVRAGGIWNGSLGVMMFGNHPLGWVGTLGRLADDATVASATDEVEQLLAGSAQPTASSGPPRQLVVRPVTEASGLGDRASLVRFMVVLTVVAGLTLVIACLNLANLSIVRTGDRAREFALRAALGAGRGRLISQVAMEHLALAAAGSLAAAVVAGVTIRLLSAFALPGSISLEGVGTGLDARAIAVVAVLSVLASGAIALGPARRASDASRAALGTRGTAGRAATHPGLLVGQVALTLVLLVAAGLFVRSLRAGLDTDLGFDPAPVSAVSVDLFRYGYDRPRAAVFYDEALASAAAQPGVDAVALSTHVPLSPLSLLPVDAPDGPYTPDAPLEAGAVSVTPAFFDVLSIPIAAGRGFTAGDGRGARRVAVVNESAARHLFDGLDPVGREVQMFGELAATVVGVVGDAKYSGVRERDVPIVYRPLLHDVPTGGVTVLARSEHPVLALSALRAAVQGIDSGVALHDVRLVSAQVDAALAPQRFGSTLLSMFAALALAVATVGIHGVVAATVSRRTAEIGVRIALGATPGAVVRGVLASTGLAVAVGAALGLGAAVLVGRSLERLLYGITPLDVVSYVGATAVLLAAAAVAVLRPARRAALTDPVVALRQE